MCSAPAASTFTNLATRSALDVVSGGALEIGGKSKQIGQAAGNMVAPPSPQAPPPPPEMVADPGPVQKTEPTTTIDSQAAAAQRARRAAAMRAGIMSTIGPRLGTLGNTTPNMPVAYATGAKTMLGQ